MFEYTSYSYGQIDFSPDARNCTHEIGESTKITYTITPAKTGQNNATNEWQTGGKQKSLIISKLQRYFLGYMQGVLKNDKHKYI